MNEVAPLPARFQKARKRSGKAVSAAKAIAEAQRVAADVEKVYVAFQPHRNGDMSAMAGSVLGSFVLRHITVADCLSDNSKISILDLQRETMEACESYARVWGNWCKHKGVPLPANFAWDLSTNGQDDGRIEERMNDWKETKEKYETAIRCAGRATYAVTRDLILFDLPIPFGWHNSARRSVQNLWSVVYR